MTSFDALMVSQSIIAEVKAFREELRTVSDEIPESVKRMINHRLKRIERAIELYELIR